MKRVGLLMKKIGCSAIYNDKCMRIPITLLQLEYNVVLSTELDEKTAKNVIKISFGDMKHVNKPQKVYFEKLGIEKKGKIMEFRLDSSEHLLEPQETLSVDHFRVGQFVDVVGTSIGKGFAGVMKRHNFHGLRASHGVSLTHRSGGSTGQNQDPGKVAKGKKMAGHLGVERVTMQNLFIQHIEKDKNLIAIKGSVPGHKNSYVLVKDALKKPLLF
jgi:large subunit ribosomal protein L3